MTKSSPKSNLLKFRNRRDSLTAPSESSLPTSSSKSTTNEPKRFLRQTGINQILNEMFIRVCRSYMELTLHRRVVSYLVLIVVGGLIGDFAPELASWIIPIKTQKKNLLNVFFVKMGWFWTTVLLTPFVVLAGRVIENRSSWVSWSDLNRVLVATFFWFISTNIFWRIEIQSGSCSSKAIQSRLLCVRSGHQWHYFDISGHTFILLYSILVIIEETKSMVNFENFGYLLDSRAQFRRKVQNKSDNHNELYTRFLVPTRVFFVLLTLLTLLWDFMLIQTVFFYHSTLQKILAAIWAVFVWFLTYKLAYPSKIFDLFRLPIRPPTRSEVLAEEDGQL